MPERVHCMLGVIDTHLLVSCRGDIGLCSAGAACLPSTSQLSAFHQHLTAKAESSIPEDGLSSRRDTSSSRPQHEVVIGKGCLQRAAAICQEERPLLTGLTSIQAHLERTLQPRKQTRLSFTVKVLISLFATLMRAIQSLH